MLKIVKCQLFIQPVAFDTLKREVLDVVTK